MNCREKQVRSQQCCIRGFQCDSETTWKKRDSQGIGLGIIVATAKCSSRNSNSEANNPAPSGSRRSLLGSEPKILVGTKQPLFPGENSVASPKVSSESLQANMISPHTHLNSNQNQTSSLTAQLKLPHFKSSYTCLNSLNAQSRFPHEQSKQIRIGMEHSESYTCVTVHSPKSTTKHVYTHFSIESETLQFPVREQHEKGTPYVALTHQSYVNVPMFHSADFLSACYFCKQQLNHGKDIYMYSGDKAFCSVECRYQQILLDEGKETFPPSPPSSSNASSHYGVFFSTSTATAA